MSGNLHPLEPLSASWIKKDSLELFFYIIYVWSCSATPHTFEFHVEIWNIFQLLHFHDCGFNVESMQKKVCACLAPLVITSWLHVPTKGQDRQGDENNYSMGQWIVSTLVILYMYKYTCTWRITARGGVRYITSHFF